MYKRMQEEGKPSETLPAEGMGCIPVTRGHRESFGDCGGRKGCVYGEEEKTPNKEEVDFFLLAGCIGSRGYWQSFTKRELNKQHQRYCVPKESQVPVSL